MKYIIVLFVTFLSLHTSGQYQYELMKMSEGVNTGVWFDVIAGDEEEVRTVWKDFMEDRSLKIKRKRRPREYRAEDVNGDEVSTLFGSDIFMQTEPVDTAIRVKIWVRQGGVFPDFWDDERAQNELHELLDLFQGELEQDRAEAALEIAKEELNDLERSLKRLARRKQRYEKRIKKAYEEIEENEQNIIDNEKEQQALREKLEAQKKRVEERKKARELLKAGN
ncbi:MAG: hypothetical protein GVX96_02395 [Bacteroidetes bacterium]|jgi:hypothetical protein|nr:hypothetical protein [Bacteroidota bacterium]